ncbi:uncharacterized protein LOC121383515 [Gigantopelta aegis]|uniref:uncharacterized protein LOC121383515 n=1 Tax=Gigantopelta aegis TaxID=1735272 RepID=UPI001B88CA50|nr:uncharacterized protein LOC121383515 [Gigantopelta aegis]
MRLTVSRESDMAATETWSSLALLILVGTAVGHVDSDRFVIDISTDGTYSILVNGVTWLRSAPTFFNAAGKTYSLGDKTLKIRSITLSSGSDKLGQWKDDCTHFTARNYNITGCIRTYPTHPDLPVVIFRQIYEDTVDGTSSGDTNGVISGFPSFQVANTSASLGFLSYGGDMFGGTAIKYGRWPSDNSRINSGLEGGPVVMFDTLKNVLITAPFNEFMAASVFSDVRNSRVSWGIMGGVDRVPSGYVYQTIMYYGDDGINTAMSDWGMLMKTYYDKKPDYRGTDLTLVYVGYWTDGGAYYYYNTEPNKTYEQTILDVRDYANRSNIPYRYVQYDSWWYYKGPGGGVKTWTPMPDVMPDGFQSVYDKTGWPASAHNRWWSPATTYAKQNGGLFDFIVEKKKAIPVEEAFWDYLFDSSRKWGLVTYEQDWLDREFEEMHATVTDISLGRTWLLQMGRAARNNGLTIQYCMSLPRHAMQSIEVPVVTQARVSGDYRAGGEQWRIGVASLFADAMGIAPFKDTFWTTKDQPGNKYNLKEPYAELQLTAATLSTGPVGPSDMIEHTNVSLLMTCCNADGMVLKPTKPAMAINSQITKSAFMEGSGPTGEVWTTYSRIGNYYFGIILGVGLAADYNLTPEEAGFNFFQPDVVFAKSKQHSTTPMTFSQKSPLKLTTACARDNICLYYTSPALSFGDAKVYIYGEENKVVPVSQQRVTGITVGTDIQVSVKGAINEEITFVFLRDNVYLPVLCNLGASGTALISYTEQSCNSMC